MSRLLFNLKIGFDALKHNKLRTLLTALGIIFGVASVIAMQAIGSGARQEILDQIKLVGVNNIVIRQKPIEQDGEQNGEQNTGKKETSLGLSLADAKSIQNIIPHVEQVSPEINSDVFIITDGMGMQGQLAGVSAEYFGLQNLNIAMGSNFTDAESRYGQPVCIIGKEVATNFFGHNNPIGRMIKCGHLWLKVTGVLDDRQVSGSAQDNFGLSSINTVVFTPVNTILLRYNNRSVITKERIRAFNSEDDEEEETETVPIAYNEVDKLIVQVSDSKFLKSTAEIIQRTLERRHNGVSDFEIIIPEHLLQQQQHTKNIFNIVLGIIAGISLLVGGIGIMNIMLVSVIERLREIGLRMALGATKQDVVFQFLSEAMLISIGGGLAGIILGILIAELITYFADIKTIVSMPAVLVAFILSAAVGLIFGIAPARKAAMQNPIESLRHE